MSVAEGTPRPAGLRGCDRPLATAYDVALLDLDGVVYRGPEAVPGAAAALERARAAGMRTTFVTNNASRSPGDVAAHLRELGVAAAQDDVVTSAQAAARMLRERLPAGARVLVLGTGALRQEVAGAGLDVVATADDGPVAVVQGLDRELTFGQLAEAALALGRGALWVAANADSTLPTPRGLLPGNGALVTALSAATRRSPLVAGKPEPALHAESVRRSGARHPLVVGDRLDTDVQGAVRAGTDCLLVLTGVTDITQLLLAGPGERPTYVSADLSGLLRPHPQVRIAADGRSTACRRGRAERSGAGVRLALMPEAAEDLPADNEELAGDLVRAACTLGWAAADAGHPLGDVRVEGDDEAVRAARHLGLG